MNRQKIFSLIIFLVAATALFLPCSAQTAAPPTTWQVNGNGYTGILVLSRINAATNEVSGTLLGTPVRGYLVGRHLVLHRYPQGRTQIWDGWILDPKLGAHGQPYYDGTLIIAGLISEDKGPVDGVYPWYAVAQSTAAPPTGSNLILNGSFEQGTVGNNRTSGITHWTVIRDNVDVVQGYWQQIHGKRSVDLAGTYGSGAIQQTFSTIPGRRYEVSFFMAGNPVCDNPFKQMRVSAAGQSDDFSFHTQGRSLGKMGWQKKSWSFIANAASTTLMFESVGPNRACGVALDDVSVVPR
jgi:choice-of-anchor C domain-containing protein